VSDGTRRGRPIIRNQAIAAKVADMYTELMAARTLTWRATSLAVHGTMDHSLTMSAKVFCTEAAVKICAAAVDIFGAAGISRDLPIEKYLRDAVTLPHMDATNPINKLKIAKILEGWIADGRLPEWGRATLPPRGPAAAQVPRR